MPNPYVTEETESYKETILRALEENRGRWFHNWELREFRLNGSWVGASGDRRCRELAEEGLIAVRYEGKYVFYGHLSNTDGRCLPCLLGKHDECDPDPICACSCAAG